MGLPIGLFCLVSVCCVLTTTGHLSRRGAGSVGVTGGSLCRVGQEAVLLSLECSLPCEPLHTQEVVP